MSGKVQAASGFVGSTQSESPGAFPKGDLLSVCLLESVTWTETEAQRGCTARHKGLQGDIEQCRNQNYTIQER